MVNDDGNSKKKEVEEQIFGQEIADDVAAEKVTDEEPIENLNPDNDYSQEAKSGVEKTLKRQDERNDTTPEISGGDLDADWQDDAAVTGEEESLGPNPTPDQDQTDAISEPWGLGYNEGEELDINKKDRRLQQDRNAEENNNLEEK